MPRGIWEVEKAKRIRKANGVVLPPPQLPRYEDVILRRDRQHWLACGEPPAWAQYRDGLVKSTPWFSGMQQSVVLTLGEEGLKKYVTGILVGGYPPDNAYIDAEILIVRC